MSDDNILHVDMNTVTAGHLRALAVMLMKKAAEKAIAGDEAYCKFLADRRAALHVGDTIRVKIDGHYYETTVRGFDTNYYGMPFVKFTMDWGKGPVEYGWNVSLVEKVDSPNGAFGAQR